MLLSSCPDCGSRLLQPVAVIGPIDRASVVARRCPECGLSDSVVAPDAAVRLWLLREHTFRALLSGIAARLADSAAEDRPLGDRSAGDPLRFEI